MLRSLGGSGGRSLRAAGGQACAIFVQKGLDLLQNDLGLVVLKKMARCGNFQRGRVVGETGFKFFD